MNQETTDIICQQLEQRINDKSLILPMLPKVTSQVLSLVNDVKSDAAALAQLIQSDQALAGHVMRIANSAAYSPSGQMTSLQQAIARLGMQNMAEIAMAATLGPKMFKVKGFESLVKEIWLFSLATAVWAREIARHGRRNVESTFLCGLLVEIGRPVILQTILDISKAEGIEPSHELVNSIIDTYQSRAGAVLADHWKLPTAVKHTITGVDIDTAAEGSQDIVDTVKAARIFAAYSVSDRLYDVKSLSINPYIIEINLYDDDVESLLEKAESVHETIGALNL